MIRGAHNHTSHQHCIVDKSLGFCYLFWGVLVIWAFSRGGRRPDLDLLDSLPIPDLGGGREKLTLDLDPQEL